MFKCFPGEAHVDHRLDAVLLEHDELPGDDVAEQGLDVVAVHTGDHQVEEINVANSSFLELSVDIRAEPDEQVDIVLLALPHVVHQTDVQTVVLVNGQHEVFVEARLGLGVGGLGVTFQVVQQVVAQPGLEPVQLSHYCQHGSPEK